MFVLKEFASMFNLPGNGCNKEKNLSSITRQKSCSFKKLIHVCMYTHNSPFMGKSLSPHPEMN